MTEGLKWTESPALGASPGKTPSKHSMAKCIFTSLIVPNQNNIHTILAKVANISINMLKRLYNAKIHYYCYFS